MFEVGRLVARIQMEGAQTFGRDLQQMGKEFAGLDSKGAQATRNLGIGLGAVGAAVTGLAVTAVARYADFDKAMSGVRANVQASPEDFKKLKAAAIDAGATTTYTASEAADAVTNLGKAGVGAKEILGGGLKGALALAAAGEIGVADAADTAATAMTQFRLSGKDVPHIADLLAAGANKAQGGVSDLSMALKQSGLVASQMGLSIEDTVGTLTAFASAGLIGSDAGTSFKTMLLALANPSAKARDTMNELGISAYDAQGKMRPIGDIAELLKTKLGNLTQEQRDSALATIFGSDAIRAANVLYNEGAQGISDWTAKVDDAGFAAKQAATLQDNLAGDVEKLGGAFDSMLITAGEGANGPLRAMVQTVTDLVDAYGSLPAPVQQGILLLGGIVGVAALAGGAFLLAVPKVIEFRAALATLNTEVPKLGKNLGAAGGVLAGPWGIAITAGLAIVSMFATSQQQAASRVEALSGTLDEQTGAFTKNTRAAVAKRLQDEGVLDAASKAGISIGLVTDAAMGNEKAYRKVSAAADEWYNDQKLKGIPTLVDASFAHDALTNNVRTTAEELGKSKDAWKQQSEAAKDGTKSAEEATAAQQAEAAATEAATKAQQEWHDAVAQADADFVDLVGAYDSAAAKAEELAKGTKGSTDKVAGALGEMSDSAKVSTESYIAELQKQVDAQNNWESNMVLLAAKVPAGMLKELADLGPKGAKEVQLMTTMTDAELQETVRLWTERGGEAPGAFADELEKAAPTIAAVGAKYGQTAVDALSAKIKAGEGLSAAMAELGLIVEDPAAAPTITPNTNTAPARADFDNAGAYAEAMQIWMHVQGDTVPARSQFKSERDYQEGLKVWLTAHGETRPVRSDFESAKEYGEALQTYLTALGNTKPVRGDFDSAKAYGDALRAWITAMANVEPAEASLSAVAAKKRYATIQAVIQGGTDAGAAKAAYSANGAVFYANGGTENHVAQIAKAGTWRVWAEDETGGEAYIPLAESKRARSTAILDTVARTFGYALVPAGAQRYANGSAPDPVSRETRSALPISGTLRLDMGNSTAWVEGVVDDRLDHENDIRAKGFRQ